MHRVNLKNNFMFNIKVNMKAFLVKNLMLWLQYFDKKRHKNARIQNSNVGQ